MNKQTWAFEEEGTGGGLKRLLERVLRGASLGMALLVASLPMAAQAENSIQSVSGSVQGGTEIIRIDLAEPLATVPTGFSIQAPARIALDFPGVSNSMGRSTVDFNLGNLRSANVVQAGERTRVVLNLKAPSTYKAEIQGKTLLITLDASASVASSTPPVQVFAESRNRDVLPLKDIDFRRGNDSSGRIVVGLSNNEVGVDIRQQGQTLVVEFLKTALPEGLRRRLDVADFGTPVQTVTTFQTGDKVRMVVEPKGSWEHSAYQSDNQFVLEVRQQKSTPPS
jgi:type IV pilus assembly protein PilQ